ncbi:hypothetical protein [Caulobacter segnis]
MKVVDYDQFVRRTDQYQSRSAEDRQNIALYGLVGELGSLMSAVKKQLLTSDSEVELGKPSDEIVEELGDIIWYCFNIVQVFFPGRDINIFRNEINFLKRMLTAKEGDWIKFQGLLGAEKRTLFLTEAEKFPKTTDLVFDDFQKLAFITARTDGSLLRKVCLSVLWQHGAELLRHKIPESEKDINPRVVDRDIRYVLGDIAWHVAAVTTVYGLSLNDVISKNVEKISFRQKLTPPTPLHDVGYVSEEAFPRQFEVTFISIGPRHSRIYIDGKRVGNDLTDNAYDPDGYRFHDVMHLANAANLGWSPVLRGLLHRKRKSNRRVDEVEDGARAAIVEEAVIKAIHSEGSRLAKERYVGPLAPDHQELFPDAEDISFKFLKFIRHLVVGLEVENNKYWEWEAAILEGYRIFNELRRNGQGTVRVDLDARSIDYSPHAYVDFSGSVSGIGSCSLSRAGVARFGALTKSFLLGKGKSDTESDGRAPEENRVAKLAIVDALGLDPGNEEILRNLDVQILDEKRVSVRASGRVEATIWARGIVCFRTSFAKTSKSISCTAVAISDL